ncbi:MAG: hypothetical protein HY688_01250 [Chloroflexi bacterium]|nr:hypothetical protein [Chloroflexota bacterium]
MQQTRQQTYPGLIDTIGAGFGVVTRRLALLLIPIFVDVALVTAPPVSFAPLLGQAVEGYKALLQQAASNPASGVSPEQATQLDDQVKELQSASKGVNLLALAAWRVPSAARMAEPAGGAFAVQVSDWGTVTLAGLGLGLGGLLLAALYLGALGQYVRYGNFSPLRYAAGLLRQGPRLLGYTLVLLGAAVGFAVPALGVTALLVRFVPPLGAFMVTLAGAVVLWAAVYLYFVDGAIFVAESGVFLAIRQSFETVRRHFWSALGLILLSVIIGIGTSIVWSWLVPTGLPWVLLASVGNAYIATGLIAASFIYFRDRSARAEPASQGGRV